MSFDRCRPIILIGAGMHGRVVRDLCRDIKRDVAGFFDDSQPKDTMIDDIKVLGKVEDLFFETWLKDHDVVITIGNSLARLEIANHISKAGGQFTTLVHPNCVISPTAQIGEGTVLIGGNMVFSGARIGAHCIIDPDSTIGADSNLADGVYICPGVHFGASVIVGRAAFLGIGAMVIPEVEIGENAIVGAGAVVTRDVPKDVLAAGNPAIPKGPAILDDISPYPARRQAKS